MFSSTRIMSWNIRGVNNNIAKRNCRDLVGKSRANIVCLQETKSEDWIASPGKSFLNEGKFSMHYQPSKGNSGGLAVFWENNLFKCVALAQARQWLWITLEAGEDGCRLHIINIYSALQIEDKRQLWCDIGEILNCIVEEPVCFVGDFNCIRSNKERVNCVYARKDMEEFNAMIGDNNLFDIGMSNARYTWFGFDKKKSRLDRALVDVVWLKDDAWQVQALSKKHSDHKALLIYCGSALKGPSPFKIFNCYLTEELSETVKENLLHKNEWRKANAHQILKHVKNLVKEMYNDGNSKLDKEIQSLERRMEALEEVSWGEDEHLEVRNKLLALYRTRDSMLSQKARVSWIALGDSNTKFFHQMIQKRRNANAIQRLFFKEEWISDPVLIKEAFFSYYSKFFQNNHTTLFSLGTVKLPKLTMDDKQNLIKDFTCLEIEGALRALAEDKAPGPDGFNVKSLKFLWPFIKPRIESLISEFGEEAILPRGLNSSFIALIPKISNPTTVKDFHPISLINSSMKILMKVLATRLARCMDKLVSDVQSGFIKGRQASEGILIVKEVAHTIQRGKGEGLILKLDFEKAFDSVNWDFLYSVMLEMNFDSKWVSWIRALLESSRISILVNGSPTKEFTPARGLRQGDPISPLLYNLVGEILNSMLTKAASEGLFKGITLVEGTADITHLQFADDTVVFLDGTLESARGIKRVLQCFQIISGLKINYNKSELYASSSAGESLRNCAEILGCKVGAWPMKYLGLPIGCSARKEIFWEPVLMKMRSKLSKWKAESLNQAGRLTLIKSVLDSLPIYWMNLHFIPAVVLKRMEKIRRDFLWGHVGTRFLKERKLHLISWGKVCKPLGQGGLGLIPSE